MKINLFVFTASLVALASTAQAQTSPTPGTAIPSSLSFSILPTPVRPPGRGVELNFMPATFARPGEVGVVVYHASW